MKRKGKRWLLVAAAVCLLMGTYLYWQNQGLMYGHVTVESGRLPEELEGFRIVQLSDLHNAQFGEGNSRLLRMVESLAPDLIAVTGDMVDSRRTDGDVAVALAEQLSGLAPVYYVPGNHESRLDGYEELEARLAAAGAVILEDRTVAVEKDGGKFTLLGLTDPAFFREGGGTPQGVELRLRALMETAGEYTVLLSHRPELFEIYRRCGVDLTLSGHAHGGQIRLPVLGGVIAPNQGFFPEYDAGCNEEGGSVLVVSRGLGNSLFPFRVNNRPELVLIELEKT